MSIARLVRSRSSAPARLAALILIWSALPLDAADDPVSAAFEKLDVDGNGTLSLEEHLKQKGTRKRLERDFRVFDIDGDGSLTPAEFGAVPGTVPPAERGAVPNPFTDLIAAAVDALDEAYGDWSRRPEGTVQTQQFVIDFMASLSPDGTRRFDASLVPIADEDSDGRVDWNEAKRFLEIQLGIRWPTGHPTVLPNGRILMMRHFVWGDANSDGAIDRKEFLEKKLFAWTGEKLEDVFARGDLDGNGAISLDEYSNPKWVAYEDPVAVFLRWDTDFSGDLDENEIEASAADYLEPLKASTVPAFDLDENGKLSLNEYRISMIGNRVVNWGSVATDQDRDKRLSFEEFKLPQGQCHLLRRFYFHRLDRDGDANLSPDEFTFKVQPPNTFHTLAENSGEFRLLYRNEDYPNCGSPAVSPDGTLIAFDGYPGGVTISGSRILLINSDGSGFKDLCAGLMPTWSKDGTQLACSRYGGQGVSSGVWIINIDGSEHKRIDDGWGAQWSPDGKSIAYTSGGVRVYDVESGESRDVLAQGEHPYQTIYWNMNWSPDSKRLAFKARKQQGYDLASISMVGDDPDLKVHFSTDQDFGADVSWSPDGNRILFCMPSEEHKRRMLHEIGLKTGGPPRIVEGTDPEILLLDGVTFTRDGTRMILATRGP